MAGKKTRSLDLPALGVELLQRHARKKSSQTVWKLELARSLGSKSDTCYPGLRDPRFPDGWETNIVISSKEGRVEYKHTCPGWGGSVIVTINIPTDKKGRLVRPPPVITRRQAEKRDRMEKRKKSQSS
jgi:hypothetical protein